MASKFLSKNGEIYRILLENEDTFWLISFENPMERPFCIAASELDSFQRVPMPQDFAPEEQNLSSAAQQRLALIQPLLDQGEDAITDRQLRLSIAKDIAGRENTTVRRVLRLYYRYLATGQVAFSKNREITVNKTYEWAIKTFYFSAKWISLRAPYVDTVGRNKKAIKAYIANQLQEDQIADQISLKEFVDPFTGSKNTRA